jgi:outer membrane protein OmpA-like peptidoglycan-associated protein
MIRSRRTCVLFALVAAVLPIVSAADSVECALEDHACIEQAENAGKQVVLKDAGGNTVSAPAGQEPGDGVWANYDFVPGNRVLFAETFDGDRVGNFPKRLTLVGGNAEVVEWKGRRMLRATADTDFVVPLPEKLPERFTVEFDYYQAAGHFAATMATSRLKEKYWNQYPGSYLTLGNISGLVGKGPEASMTIHKTREGLTPVRVQVDGSYVKVYLDEQRVANAPNAVVIRGDAIQFHMTAKQTQPAFLGNVRIAAGGRDLYDDIKADGRAVTHGILFDVNSSRIRPESTPTLEEIGKMLASHADLRLSIEGHTDHSGDDDFNLRLSERRANAVRSRLIAAFKIDGARLKAVGHGETRPAGSNDTPEGRQSNRRVELVEVR